MGASEIEEESAASDADLDDDEVAASESTIPDLDIDKDVLEAYAAGIEASGSEPPAAGDADADADGEGGAVVEGSGAAAAARTSIPAPSLTPVSGPAVAAKPGGWSPDGLAIAAIVVFVLVGAVLVFNFARALIPAAEAQLGAACRPLAPESRTGPAPALELEDLDGNPVSLADYEGKFLVVNFWATWCEPCTREWPDLDTLGQRMAERDDVAVIAISVDERREDILPYLERMGLGGTSVEILRAKDPTAHQSFGSDKIPDTYFVDRQGQLEAVFVNVRDWGRAKAVRCVEASAGEG